MHIYVLKEHCSSDFRSVYGMLLNDFLWDITQIWHTWVAVCKLGCYFYVARLMSFWWTICTSLTQKQGRFSLTTVVLVTQMNIVITKSKVNFCVLKSTLFIMIFITFVSIMDHWYGHSRTWTAVNTNGDPPSPRSFHKMVALKNKVKPIICSNISNFFVVLIEPGEIDLMKWL